MNMQLPIYLLIGLVGTGIGLLLQRPTATLVNTQATSEDTHIVESIQPISNPAGNNMDLREEIARLTKSLGELAQTQKYQQEQIASLQRVIHKSSVDSTEKADTGSNVLRTQERGPIDQKPEAWFDLNAMIVAGVDENEAGRLKKLYEDIELKKLFLRDKAIREGWGSSSRYGDEQSALEDQLSNLRNDLDDKTYDAFLYAAGRPNRVVVRSLLSNSPAEQAGAQAGDIIISYGDKRVYDWNDIRTLTTLGQPSEMVTLVVQRDGKQQTLYVPRGPLGIKLDSTSTPP